MTEMKFVFPLDCVMLTNAAGRLTSGGLEIHCFVNALPGRNLEINGIPLIFKSNYYSTSGGVILTERQNNLTLRDTDTGERRDIEVFWLKNAHKKYRFSLDDNIWFLQNLAKNQHVYSSIFEDPYLKLLKTMHDKFKTKFHLNIYYECPEFGGFNLTQLSEKYKDEFKANSHWMRLSAHSNANLPDRPYIQATYNQTYFEFNRINEQIIRFAGEEAFADSVTTFHWGEATDDAVRAARDIGVRAMVGSFRWASPTNTSIAYNLDAEKCAVMQSYGLYYDKSFDMMYFLYGRGSLQRMPLDQVADSYSRFEKELPLYTFREICVHEQYFYKHYASYMPDYYQRFETGIRWCVENGYEPAFASEAFDI